MIKSIPLKNIGIRPPALVEYLPGTFAIRSPGDHVCCAVTGKEIPLNKLRYWSKELQEAYIDAQTAVARYAQVREKF